MTAPLTPKQPGKPLTQVTVDLKKRLWIRYHRDHVVLFEVPVDGHKLIVGPADGRLHEVASRQSIDAVTVGMWRSTRHVISAFEIKASMSDLARELTNPLKSRAAMRVADHFWLVVPDQAVIATLSPSLVIPLEWGVLESHLTSLRVVRWAAVLHPNGTAGVGSLDRRFAADLVGAAVNRVHDPYVIRPSAVRGGRTRRRRRSG